MPDGRALPALLVRFDVLAGTRVVIRDAGADPFDQPAMSRDGSTFAWVGANEALLVATVGERPVAVATPCPPARANCAVGPALTADGRRVLYFVSGQVGGVTALETFDRVTLARVTYPEFRPTAGLRVIATASGSHVYAPNVDGSGGVFDLATRRLDPVPVTSQLRQALSDDGRFVMMDGGRVYDRVSSLPLEVGGVSRGLSADGRLAAVEAGGLYVLIDMDSDNDGMHGHWEMQYGLNPHNADGEADADGDGVRNREEFARGSHPRGLFRRHLAEGVVSDFFDTAVYVASGEATTPITVTFTDAAGVSSSRAVVGAQGFYGYRAGEARVPAALQSGPVSIIVESDAPVAAERLTTWAGGDQRGAHAATGVEPSSTWFFAEGATTGSFHTFYLLANPGEQDAAVDVTYLCRRVGAVSRTYRVPARGRTTVWVNQEGAPLDAAECGASMESSHPIVAERSVYLLDGNGFAAGTSSAGRPRAATSWRFAAGDTRAPLEAFLLLANPWGDSANATVRFGLSGGEEEVRHVALPPFERVTVWVDQEGARLANTPFSIVIDSSLPIVAERSMWWGNVPGGPWVEGHTEAGALTGASRWALAHLPESATIHILNESSGPATVRMRLILMSEGRLATERTLEVPPGVTAFTPSFQWPALGPGLYSAVFDSLPVGDEPAVPIVVERTHRVPLRNAGTAVLATPLP